MLLHTLKLKIKLLKIIPFIILSILIIITFYINSNLEYFGDYKPLYFKSESELKNANKYINSLGFKTISEYTSKVSILDFPKQKEILINEIKNISNSDIRKDNFLKKLTNLFNIENKKVLYVEKKFKNKNLLKLNKKPLNQIKCEKYKTKINCFFLISYLLTIIALFFLNKNYLNLKILLFLTSLVTLTLIFNKLNYFYPFMIPSYLLFLNNLKNKIRLKNKQYLYLFIVTIYLYILTILIINIKTKPFIFILTFKLSIFILFMWIKNKKNLKEKFFIYIQEKQKITKIKSTIYYLLFLLNITPFIYSIYILSTYKNIGFFYSKKLNYFNYLSQNYIYLMTKYNEDLPNIADYLSHEFYQNELKYNSNSQYGIINKKVTKNYFEIKGNKIILSPKIIYKIDKNFIEKKLEKNIAKLFLNKNTPILIYKETKSDIKAKKNQIIKLFTFSSPFFIFLFLFKAIRFKSF